MSLISVRTITSSLPMAGRPIPDEGDKPLCEGQLGCQDHPFPADGDTTEQRDWTITHHPETNQKYKDAPKIPKADRLADPPWYEGWSLNPFENAKEHPWLGVAEGVVETGAVVGLAAAAVAAAPAVAAGVAALGIFGGLAAAL